MKANIDEILYMVAGILFMVAAFVLTNEDTAFIVITVVWMLVVLELMLSSRIER